MARQRHHHCSFLLLLCLLPVSSVAKDLWAIDCGGTRSFIGTENITGLTTNPTDITWEVDGSYVHGGVSRSAKNTDNAALMTLRAFEADKPAKGCYTIPVGKERKVQVSAWFYYGNYDDQRQPPTFLLQFDANEWGVIKTNTDDFSLHQAIYVTKSNSTSICVARGSTREVPFISALIVTVLEEAIYDTAANSSKALFPKERVAFGANDTIVDKYFRYWFETTTSLNIFDYRILTNQATNFSKSRPDNVPLAVVQTAITPTLAEENFVIADFCQNKHKNSRVR